MRIRPTRPVATPGIGLIAAAAGVAGAAVVLVLTANGPGISVDSVNYLSAAAGVWSTGTFEGFLPGSRLAEFPPLYPLLLVPGEALGAPFTGARIVGAVAFGLLVAAGVIGSAMVARGFAYALAGAVAVLVSTPVAGVSSFIWSDAPFAAAVAGFLLVASRIGRRRDAVVLAGVLAGIATSIRYLGVTAIPVGMLAIWLWSDRRRRDLVVFAVLSATAPLLWVVRNLVVTSTPAGERHPASEGLETALRTTASTLGRWIDEAHPLAGAGAVALLALAALPAVRRLPLSRLETVALAFCALYVAWVVVSAASVSLDPIDDRFLAPLYVPLVWLAMATTGRLLALAAERVGRLPAVVAVAVAVVWAGAQAGRLPDLADAVDRSSLARVPMWSAGEQTLARRVSGRIYSNAPDAVWLRSRGRVLFSPRRERYRSDAALDELGPLRRRIAGEGAAVLVWFRELRRPAVYTPAELAHHLRLRHAGSTPSADLFVLGP